MNKIILNLAVLLFISSTSINAKNISNEELLQVVQKSEIFSLENITKYTVFSFQFVDKMKTYSNTAGLALIYDLSKYYSTTIK